MFMADVLRLYPSIPDEAGLKALEKAFNKCANNKKVTRKGQVKMAKFVLKSNYFEFNGKVKQQILETTIGTKFARLYICGRSGN